MRVGFWMRTVDPENGSAVVGKQKTGEGSYASTTIKISHVAQNNIEVVKQQCLLSIQLMYSCTFLRNLFTIATGLQLNFMKGYRIFMNVIR